MSTTLSETLRGRRARLFSLLLSSALFLGILAPRASAITINLVNAGGTQPANGVGGGSLPGAINAAKMFWENAIGDAHNLTLTYSWGPLGGTTLGEHGLTAQAGGRETAGTIVFDNDGSSQFFLDPTPIDSSEWGSYTEGFVNNVGGGGGNMNVARFYSGPTGLAVSKWDLFTVALHEMGHALGMSSANTAYQGESWPDNDVDVAAPLDHAGAQIPTNNSATPATALTSNAHIPVTLHQYVLMNPGHGGELGVRELGSCADILANAQISQWTDVDCEAIVPEPSSLALAGLGVLGLIYARARRRRT